MEFNIGDKVKVRENAAYGGNHQHRRGTKAVVIGPGTYPKCRMLRFEDGAEVSYTQDLLELVERAPAPAPILPGKFEVGDKVRCKPGFYGKAGAQGVDLPFGAWGYVEGREFTIHNIDDSGSEPIVWGPGYEGGVYAKALEFVNDIQNSPTLEKVRVMTPQEFSSTYGFNVKPTPDREPIELGKRTDWYLPKRKLNLKERLAAIRERRGRD